VVERRAAQGAGRGEMGRGAVQAVFYVVDSVIFQAPTVQAVLEGRAARCLHHLRGAFGALRELGGGGGGGGGGGRGWGRERPVGAPGIPTADAEWERKMDRMVGAVLQRYASGRKPSQAGRGAAGGVAAEEDPAPTGAAPMDGVVGTAPS